MIKRLVSAFLCFVFMISSCAFMSGCNDKKRAEQEASFYPISDTATFTGLRANDDDLLFNNPDRGFRTEFVIMLKKTHKEGEMRENRTVYVDESEEQMRKDIQSTFHYVFQKL